MISLTWNVSRSKEGVFDFLFLFKFWLSSYIVFIPLTACRVHTCLNFCILQRDSEGRSCSVIDKCTTNTFNPWPLQISSFLRNAVFRFDRHSLVNDLYCFVIILAFINFFILCLLCNNRSCRSSFKFGIVHFLHNWG